MESITVNISTEVVNFWSSLKLYFEQPKCLNKQVLFAETMFNVELISSLNVTDYRILVDNVCTKLSELKDYKINIQALDYSQLKILTNTDVNTVFINQMGKYLLVRRLIPKLNMIGDLRFYEFIFLDKSLSKAYIFTKTVPAQINERHFSAKGKKQDPFVILKFDFLQLSWYRKFLEISYNEYLNEKGVTWLKTVFVPKFGKLSSSALLENASKKLSNLQYNSKVDIKQYYQLYEEMKVKYGEQLLKNWNENTDPKKFVYEDIAIATYLRMLWNNGNIPGENEKKQKFIDLGCGNGLLVHLLNSEGHLGVGLDVRKRKIWEIYPPSTVLKEETIIPTTATKYPDADWLIGNHADELTAWIPIMARLSNDHCQYFLIPCCPYQLNGTKFQRKNAGLSSYQDFISYLKDLSEESGFITYVDKLRIPSTKRICLIGLNNPEMSELNYNSLVEATHRFVDDEIKFSSSGRGQNYIDSGVEISVNVKLRNSLEPVRNCTKLPKGFINSVLKIIMNKLLKDIVICIVKKQGKYYTWNRGGKLSLRELASCLEEQIIKQLKNECKGLQTLLKNQHFLFEVTQGYVQFRKPESMLDICNRIMESQDKEKWKIKKCWLFNNHPDKCPLADEVCSYKHEL